jgi:hypothetical protein
MSDETSKKWWMPRSRKRVLMALVWMGVASTAWLSLAVPNQPSENILLDPARSAGLFAAPAIAIGTDFARLGLAAGILGLLLGSILLTIAGIYAAGSYRPR